MKIIKCRSCKSKKLEQAFSLGKQSLTGVFPENKKQFVTKGYLFKKNKNGRATLQPDALFLFIYESICIHMYAYCIHIVQQMLKKC